MEQKNNITPNSQTYVSPYSATSSSSGQPNYVSPYPPVYVSPYPPINIAEEANTSEQASGNIKTTRAYKKPQPGIPKLSWNAQADAFVLAGHSTGKTLVQIRGQLALYGYTASRSDVGESLRKQGIMKFNLESKQPVPLDSESEAYILNAHNHGQTPVEIATQLCKSGYLATGAIVVENLTKQGITAQLELPVFTASNQETLESEPEDEVDKWVLAAYTQGQTVSEIAHQLCKDGHNATVADVIAFLSEEGVDME